MSQGGRLCRLADSLGVQHGHGHESKEHATAALEAPH